ncbi:hypothetical protein Q8F55_008213 [Vanrija albida]|uniref:Uncharacterized protein n=1 Tax=Vanrija albida TaxID=181172 RepID=A0ABR3PVQ1_9TREE
MPAPSAPNAAIGPITTPRRAIAALSDPGRGGRAYTHAVLAALVESLRAAGRTDAEVDAALAAVEGGAGVRGHCVASFRAGLAAAEEEGWGREPLPPYSLM